MNHNDKTDLRKMRDDMEAPEDRALLRKAINYISALEEKLNAIRVHARAITTEASTRVKEEC